MTKSKVLWSIYYILIILLVCLTTLIVPCLAGDLGKVDELSLQYKRFISDGRNPLIYPEVAKEALDLHLNTTFFRYMFANFTVESLTSPAQFRETGLEVHLGVRPASWLEVAYFHHSQHVLDRDQALMPKFPVADAVEVKLYLIGGNKEGLFK